MKQKIDASQSSRFAAYQLWMDSPMPMVTVVKRFRVGRLWRRSRRMGVKFNALLCYEILKVARHIPEFYVLPADDGLYRYDALSINVIVTNAKGGINSCDIQWSEDWQQFYADYLQRTRLAAERCESLFSPDNMIIGTSAVMQTEIDAIVNQYSKKFCNPFLSWGKIQQHPFRKELPISFQFHHVQMDGKQAATFLQRLQEDIYSL